MPASGGKEYNEFYAAVKKLGQYELVTDPTQADQIFETNFTNPWHCVQNTVNPFEDVIYDPRYELIIRDRRGKILRGPFVVEAKPAILLRNQLKNSLQAIDTVVKWTAGQAVAGNAKLAAREDAAIVPPAPAPLSRATTIFIAREVKDATEAMADNVPDDLYHRFYSAMQRWGRYKLVPDAAGADLLIDLAVIVDHGRFCNDPRYDPQVTLRVMLPNRNVMVYGFSRQLEGWLSYRPHGTSITNLRVSQQGLQKTADAMVGVLHRQAARADAAATPNAQ